MVAGSTPEKASSPTVRGATFSRRRLLGTIPVTAGVLLGIERLPGGSAVSHPQVAPDAFPQQDPELVRDIVLYAHFDLDRVTGLVDARPELAKAAFDWGFGDWESALGAASHTGQREIARVLIEHGARPNLFTHAMLGELSVVRAAIEARPGIQSIPGPHGITLLQHARNGGEAARGVLAYLQEIGGADPVPVTVPLPLDLAEYVGTYRYGPSADQTFEIVDQDGRPAFLKEGGFPRALVHLGDNACHPLGAPSVRLLFGVVGGRVGRIVIRGGGEELIARLAG